jgi:hypothetical protein
MELIEDQVSSKTPFQAVGRGSCQVRVLRTAEEVEEIREFWSSTAGTAHSDIDVLLTTCRAGSPGTRPHVLVLYRDGKPVALVSGVISCMGLSLDFGYLRFRPVVRVLTVPYGGLRGEASPEDCGLLVREMIRSLKNGEAVAACLQNLDTESAFFNCARFSPSFLCRDHLSNIRPHRGRTLPKGVDQVYRELSSNGRRAFKRIRAKLETDFPGQVLLERFGDAKDLGDFLQVVEAIAQRAWQRRIGGGFNMSAPVIEQLRSAAEKGWLRVYILHLAGQPCAFWTGTIYQGVFYCDYAGYDPAYEEYSPGMYILSCIMEDLCSTGFEAIDFAGGPEEWKKRFGNQIRMETTLHIFAPSFEGIRLGFLRLMIVMVKESVRWFLDRAGLTQKVKKMWRKAPWTKGAARASGTGARPESTK